MKNKKTWLVLLAAWSSASLLALQALAASATVDGVTWKYNTYNNKAVVTGASPAVGALTIPSKLGGYPVVTIADSAFSRCQELTRVAVPEGVTSIQASAFGGCAGLTSVTLPSTLTNLGYSVFWGCNSLKTVKFPSGITGFGPSVFSMCHSLESVAIPNGTTEIFDELSLCTNLVSVSFPSSLKLIRHNSFSGCSRLAAVNFPSGLQQIEGRSFANCSSLKEVVIPASVELVNGFESCRNLATVAILGNDTRIEGMAFQSCTSLETFYVPASWEGTSKPDMLHMLPEWCKVVYCRLALAASNRNFTASAASSKEFGVTANMPWTAKSSASWLTVKTAKGSGNGKIVYDVAANTGTARTGKITVAGYGVTRTFTVTQEGKTAVLELGATERSFTADAASGKLLAVTANVAWTAKSSASWLTVKTAGGSGNGNIEYAVAANAGAARTGTITVTGGGLARTFTVTQSGKIVTLELGASERSFPPEGASGASLAVTADVAWTASSSASWLTVETAGGTGNGSIAYSVAANTQVRPRTGTITVSGGGLTRTFTVTQDGQSETQESPVGVPCRWLEENAAGILAANGGDYEAAAKAVAANGRAVWECYVAGLGTTEQGAEFKVKAITVADGEVLVEWEPDLNASGAEARVYTVEGKRSMEDEWGERERESRFFRVKVAMP